MVSHSRPIAVSLLLFGAALGLLIVGRFVQFDDLSGTGSDLWILPLGLLALPAAVSAVVVAWSDAKARLWLGIVQAVLFGCLVWQQTGNDGFRFIWHRDEGELVLLGIGLGVTAAVLIATAVQPSTQAEAEAARVAGEGPGAGRWLVRAAVYLGGSVAFVFLAFLSGASYYAATECDGSESDCLATLGGLAWGVVSVPVAIVLIVVIELVLARRRKRRHPATSTRPGPG